MKIAITGASGKTGYRISEEAVKKGYKVRQIIRKNSKVSAGLERLETIRVSLNKNIACIILYTIYFFKFNEKV